MRKGSVLRGFVSLLAVCSMAMPAFAQGMAEADKTFIKDAGSGGMMEVQLGQMAQEKGKMQEVRDFGKRMVTDHGKANDELKALASKKGVPWPAKLELKHRMMVGKFKKVSAEDFDKKYMKAMVKDHTKDVDEFSKATKWLEDPELKAWTAKTLPVLEQHHKQAKELAQKLGVKVK